MMFFKSLFLVFAAAVSVQAAAIPHDVEADGPPGGPKTFTATRVYKTITDEFPYIIEATTTVTWTAGPTTTITHPTGPGAHP
ncbi:hypothetical protein R3P38DRAFT_619939 [Favolaschia claudopus]|uniref:Uncharacterized protein n=1 Tax=Favolaschia claudopus TaxID=2862362 RepID=A0AAW0CBF3_9AGAR